MNGLGLARADVIRVLVVDRSGATRSTADTATDQRAQQIAVGRIVPTGKGLVLRERVLHQVKLLLIAPG
jgi:hypothetical protein